MLADRSVRAVVLITFVLMLGNGIVLPILPLFARSFGVGYGAAGLLIAAYGIARIGCDLGAGVVVDRVGERAAGAAGLASMTAFAVLTGLAPSFAAAVVFWGAVGVSSAVTQTASYAFLLRVVPVAQMARTMGIFYGSFNVGLAAGGFVGGFIADHFGLESPLYAAAGLYALAGALYLLFVPRLERVSSSEAPPSSSWRQGLIRVARTPGLTAAAVSQLAYLWIFAAVFGTLLALFGRDELECPPPRSASCSPSASWSSSSSSIPQEASPTGTAARSSSCRRSSGSPPSPRSSASPGSCSCSGSWWPAWRSHQGSGAWLPARCSRHRPSGRARDGRRRFRLFGDVGFALGPLVAGAVAASAGLTKAFLVSAVPAVVALALVARTPETLGAASRA